MIATKTTEGCKICDGCGTPADDIRIIKRKFYPAHYGQEGSWYWNYQALCKECREDRHPAE